MQEIEFLLWLRANPSSFIINIYLKLKNSKERKFDVIFELFFFANTSNFIFLSSLEI